MDAAFRKSSKSHTSSVDTCLLWGACVYGSDSHTYTWPQCSFVAVKVILMYLTAQRWGTEQQGVFMCKQS